MTLKTTQKADRLYVYVVMNGDVVDRVYLNKKAASRRVGVLLRENSHLPPTHFNIEEHITRGFTE